MKSREFDLQARRLAQAAVISRILTPVVREAISDRKVRAAAGEAIGTGRKVYEDLRGSDARSVASRMARDERLQTEVAALVRSAVHAVDEGIASGRRSARRRMIRFTMLVIATAGLVGVVLRRRSRAMSGADDAFDVHAQGTETTVPHAAPIT